MATSNFYDVNLEDAGTATSLKTSRDGNAKLKIALVGETGSGKSSFINAIRGLEDGDDGAARTGFEKTIVVNSYPHPFNPNVTLWDHPGLDTLKHSDPKSYFQTFYLRRFDVFLLFIKGKYTKTDRDLAKELDSINKPFFLVRTKIDNDMPRGGKSNNEKILKKIKENALEMLADLNDGYCEKKIFLISNFDPEKWDFDRLKKAMLYDLQPSQPKITASPSETVARVTEIDEQIKAIDKGSLLRDLRKKMEDFAYEVKTKGVLTAKKHMEETLENWKEEKIKLAFVGNSGSGKSSLINALRGLKNDDPGAAETGVTETTTDPTEYHYLDNPNIALYDLPGVGSKKYPDLKSYCKKIDLWQFDEFVIITATRFTGNDVELAKKLRSMNKPFFFVRTKIDLDCHNEEEKESFDEGKMLEKIKKNCSDNLKGLFFDIFLISNKHPVKWDFPRLVEAILNKLSLDKQVCFVFSMYIVSESILEEKVKRLRGRIWRVAFLSVLKKIGSKEKSRTYDLSVIKEKVEFYIHQLGFPEKDSKEFEEMSAKLQEAVREFYLTSEMDVETWLKKFDANGADEAETIAKQLPWLDEAQAIAKPFGFVYCSLNRVLDEMSGVSLEILHEKVQKQLSFKYN